MWCLYYIKFLYGKYVTSFEAQGHGVEIRSFKLINNSSNNENQIG